MARLTVEVADVPVETSCPTGAAGAYCFSLEAAAVPGEEMAATWFCVLEDGGPSPIEVDRQAERPSTLNDGEC